MAGNSPPEYVLDEQVGYLLRLASQRHVSIFQSAAELDLTPTQFSALVRLAELGNCSQNELGRRTMMDAATIKGVVDRLRDKDLIRFTPHTHDRRRRQITLSAHGNKLVAALHALGHEVTRKTLEPLTEMEQRSFLILLAKLA